MENTEAIEAELAHLRKTVDELSEIVALQDTELRRLRAQVDMLLAREAAREAEAGGGVILGDERPPHW